MLPTENHLKQIRIAIDAIQPLGDGCWTELNPLIYIKNLEKKEHFSREGQQTKELGLVCSGILRVYYISDNGDEWNKHFFQANNFVAASVSPGNKSITNIQALEKTPIICIPYSDLIELSNKYSVINVFVQNLITAYLEQKQEREISLLSGVALDRYLCFKKTFPGLENRIKQYHVASYLGITPTQLSRLRKQLKFINKCK